MNDKTNDQRAKCVFADRLLWARETVWAGLIPADVAQVIVGLYYAIMRPIVTTGANHALIVVDNTVRVFGHNRGDVTMDHIVKGQNARIKPSSRIIGAICSESFAMIWTRSERYTWGDNGWGELGLGHTSPRDAIEWVLTPQKIISAACGRGHVLALCVDAWMPAGENTCIIGWGRHMWRGGYVGCERLGVPVMLPIKNPCAVAVTGIFSFILAQGRVHAFSYNTSMCILDYTGITCMWASSRAFTIMGDGMRFETPLDGQLWLEPSEFRRDSATEWPPSDGFITDVLSYCSHIPEVPGVPREDYDGSNFAITVTSRGVYKFFKDEAQRCDVICLYAL